MISNNERREVGEDGMNKQKLRRAAALLVSAMVAVSCAVALPACTEKDMVSHNVSQDTNNFNDSYELNFLPEALPGVSIVSKD